MVMDFKDDPKALKQAYQYMFGKSILVAPVTMPEAKDWKVYLPKETSWYDFWTDKSYDGGQNITADASKNKIPLFVKSGSIIPSGPIMQYSSEKSNETMTVKVYSGQNGFFELYEDEGDNYNYEKGNYSLIPFTWNEKNKTLKIGIRQGTFEGMTEKRTFNISVIGLNGKTINRSILYDGRAIKSEF